MPQVRPYIIGIAGGTCSGKTLLAQQVVHALELVGAVLLPLDCYYRDLSHLDPAARAKANFDIPDALEQDLLLKHVQALGRGESVWRPGYDYATHTRASQPQRVEPSPYVVVEGLLALYWKPLRDLMGTRVFLAVSDALALERRIERDIRERGRTTASVEAQFAQTVLPMYRRYCEPTRRHAHLVLDGARDPDALTRAVLKHVCAQAEAQTP